MNKKSMNRIVISNIILIVIAILFCNVNTAFSQSNLTQKPEALPEVEFKFPDYQTKVLSNGLTVFVIKDSRQPIFGMRMYVYGGSSVDGNLPGLGSIAAELITKGIASKKGTDIPQKFEELGSMIEASSDRDKIILSTQSLKKNWNEIIEMFSGIVTDPLLPETHFDKIKSNKISEIKIRKANSQYLANSLARKVLFGDEHPYSQIPSEEIYKKIKLQDVKSYHERYFVPGNSTVAVWGDVDADEVFNSLEKQFSSWKSTRIPQISPPPTNSQAAGVYYIKRPGAVQSSIIIANPAILFSERNYEVLDLAADLMGGGVGGRLFQTVREKYSYSYTPFGYLTSFRLANAFLCGAEVRNSVTDSAIGVIIDLLRDLSSNAPSETELNRIKKYTVGKFRMSQKDPAFIASLVQDAALLGVTVERMKSFDDKRMNIAPLTIKNIAKKYLNPIGSLIIVVGDPEIENNLSEFGRVVEYNADIMPISGDKGVFEQVSITPEKLIRKYIEAIGGETAVNSITGIIKNASMVMTYPEQTPVKGKLTYWYKSPDRMYQLIDMESFMQELWVNGDSSWSRTNSMFEKDEGILKEKSILLSKPFQVAELLKLGYKCEVLGIQNEYLVMKATSALGSEISYFFHKDSYILLKKETIETGSMGKFPVLEEFLNYEKIGNVALPNSIKETSPYFSVEFNIQYELNPNLDDTLFLPKVDDK